MEDNKKENKLTDETAEMVTGGSLSPMLAGSSLNKDDKTSDLINGSDPGQKMQVDELVIGG